MRSVLSRFAAFLAVVTLAGCGGGGSPVTGTVSFGSVKPTEGEKWGLNITDGGKNAHSAEVDASGKFTFDKVPAGTYTVNVTHYLPVKGDGKGPSAPPKTVEYPEKWTVPGGPFNLDLSKLPKK